MLNLTNAESPSHEGEGGVRFFEKYPILEDRALKIFPVERFSVGAGLRGWLVPNFSLS